MQLHRVAKGVVFTSILTVFLVLFLIASEFQISPLGLTVLFLTVVFAMSLLMGMRQKKMAGILGFFIGLFSACFLLLFLASQSPLDWEYNMWILIAWSLIGFIGGAVGSKLRK